jgi:DAACS family dicarboxylate/amino acid:cation (Na+ or H+) symporter
MADNTSEQSTTVTPNIGLVAWWQNTPLYWRIVVALVLGVVTGLVLGSSAAALAVPGQLVLRLLGALAPPLIERAPEIRTVW